MSGAMKSRFLYSVATALLGAAGLFSSPAYADHPWKDAPQSAQIVADAALDRVQLGSLLPHGADTFLALSEEGRPVLLDSQNHTHPFPIDAAVQEQIPPLAFLTQAGSDYWGLAVSPQAKLVHLSVDGKPLGEVPFVGGTLKGSNLTALQVHGSFAYMTDEGKPALVVVSLKDGKAQRFLPYDPSVTGRRPFTRNAQITNGPDGHPLTGGNVRFLALDAKGQWLFYMPACGPLYRIDASLLTDPAFTPVEQLDGIVEWRDTPSLGGIALSPENVFYMSDLTDGALLQFGSERNPLILIRDTRLLEAGALAVSDSHQVAVLTSEDGKPHILRIALP